MKMRKTKVTKILYIDHTGVKITLFLSTKQLKDYDDYDDCARKKKDKLLMKLIGLGLMDFYR
ncbi:hypothetical protein DERP_009080 [Dermatophagoides pteronyssinus]|uniref:Uncharacterized protein n=1 Tax=Dermatophagoides pteronyssinus TaxID=6956 RepID=A0ABQ8JH17_DERPT|nr:hypothetical protein DERP_009080 [Dermatophagoides pteronyssinus]